MTTRFVGSLLGLSLLLAALSGCGDDDGNAADRVGIGAACASSDDCPRTDGVDGGRVQLMCLPEFAGGYCGLQDCTSAADCPEGSTCVAHEGRNYCFRECLDKPECNRNRPMDVEANCSSSFDFADPADDVGQKACIPPSSGL